MHSRRNKAILAKKSNKKEKERTKESTHTSKINFSFR